MANKIEAEFVDGTKISYRGDVSKLGRTHLTANGLIELVGVSSVQNRSRRPAH